MGLHGLRPLDGFRCSIVILIIWVILIILNFELLFFTELLVWAEQSSSEMMPIWNIIFMLINFHDDYDDIGDYDVYKKMMPIWNRIFMLIIAMIMMTLQCRWSRVGLLLIIMMITMTLVITMFTMPMIPMITMRWCWSETQSSRRLLCWLLRWLQ